MSQNDRIILGGILDQKNQELAPTLSKSDYFEIFTAEQVLKDFDLSYEQLKAGVVGDGGDGGIDSIYLFVNGDLIMEDTDLSAFKKDIAIDLIFIQSKTSSSFSETPIDKFIAASCDLLDLSNNIDALATIYNASLRKAIGCFRETYKKLGSRFPTLRLSYHYATTGEKPHPNVVRKVERLKSTVEQLFSSVEFSFTFSGARELLTLARRAPKTTFQIELSENPIAQKDAYVCLVMLRSYFAFIVDDNKKLRRSLFEANVRDYQGEVTVNEGIQDTLSKSVGDEDFWWLNNGITIVSTRATLSGKTLAIEDPQIVNGLQSSTELYKYFMHNNTEKEERNILVRVIVPPKIEIRDRIIKATNSQTKIPQASLRATDKIHNDIEDFFLPYKLYYDRRKNHYKNEGKPIDRIVSITLAAQSVMAIALGRPNSARARPSSLLNDDDDYQQVFNEKYPLEMYLACVKLIKWIEGFLRSDKIKIDSQERTDIKFHLAMYVAMKVTEAKTPTPEKIAKIEPDIINEDIYKACYEQVLSCYQDLGGTNQVSKSVDFVNKLLDAFDSSTAMTHIDNI